MADSKLSIKDSFFSVIITGAIAVTFVALFGLSLEASLSYNSIFLKMLSLLSGLIASVAMVAFIGSTLYSLVLLSFLPFYFIIKVIKQDERKELACYQLYGRILIFITSKKTVDLKSLLLTQGSPYRVAGFSEDNDELERMFARPESQALLNPTQARIVKDYLERKYRLSYAKALVRAQSIEAVREIEKIKTSG